MALAEAPAFLGVPTPEVAVDTRFSGRVIARVSAAGSAGGGRARRGCSGESGKRADRVEDGGEVVLPGPAGGHPECPLAAAAGQAGGDLEQLVAAGAGGLDRPVREADLG